LRWLAALLATFACQLPQAKIWQLQESQQQHQLPGTIFKALAKMVIFSMSFYLNKIFKAFSANYPNTISLNPCTPLNISNNLNNVLFHCFNK